MTCSQMDMPTIQSENQRVFRLFEAIFDYRNRTPIKESLSIESIEAIIIRTFLAWTMKLNESLFKPMFMKILHWANIGDRSARTIMNEDLSDRKDNEGRYENDTVTYRFLSRTLFFYRLLNALSDALKTIIVPYYSAVLDDIIRYLSISLDSNIVERIPPLYSSLIEALVDCLRQLFLYDSEGFLNKDRFDKLLQPLVNQLDNPFLLNISKKTLNREENSGNEKIDGNEVSKDSSSSSSIYERFVVRHLAPCLSQMAMCVHNDIFWQPLNHQILLKTRSEFPQVRFAALKVIEHAWLKLGEEWLILLPESVPFFAELMEDSNPLVEQQCNKVIHLIETHLGDEKISSYL